MTNERATKQQLEERRELAAEFLAKGWPANEVVNHLAATYNVTAQQARSYVREGKVLVLELLDEGDIKFEFYSCLNDLKRDRLDAREAGNFSAAVGATKARVKLLEQLPSIDPGGCWGAEIQNSFNEFVKDRLSPATGKIPKESIMKKVKLGKDLDRLDECLSRVDPITGLEIDPITGRFLYDKDEIPF
tara:strand:+ start:1229 stop:1795 length:567 start_codon:yes stop_codon:yes gene_type:complete